MISALRGLGNLVLQHEASQQELNKSNPKVFLPCIVAGVPGDAGEIVKITFSLDEEEIQWEKIIRATKRHVREYLWVGNSPGNKPQNRLTTNQVRYLFSGSILNILRDLREWLDKDVDLRDLGNLLQRINDRYFEQGPRGLIIKRGLLGLNSTLGDPNAIASEFLERNELRQKNGSLLFTVAVKVRGKVVNLAKHNGYFKYLERIFLRPHNAEAGFCHICGSAKEVLADPDFPAGSPLKIYVIDKSGFMSGVSDTDAARRKTMAVCMECLRYLYTGVAFIEQNFKLRVGPFKNVYLIPQVSPTMGKIQVWSERIKDVFGAVNSFEGLSKVQKDIQDAMFYDGNAQYSLHILFGERMMAKFDFKRLVQDVPISRLHTLRQQAEKWENHAEGWFGDGSISAWYLGFQEIARLFPIRVRKGTPSEWSSLIELYNAILSATHYPAHQLLKRGLLLARIHRFGNYSPYYLKKPKNSDIQMIHDTIKINILQRYLQDVNVLSVERVKQTQNSQILANLPNTLSDWIKLMEFDVEQQALFLLGILIGEIGTAQYSKGDKKKAILDKLRFDGMDLDRVHTLANRLLEYLRIYRLLTTKNESVYACAMALLNEHAKTWSKGPDENVFYILSGYSFVTLAKITKRQE